MFIDSAKIHIKSGDGGAGAVSFRREKYVAAGGPDGGDGGSGGNVIFQVDDNVSTLADYRYRRKFAAQNGKPGGAKRCSGKKGKTSYCVYRAAHSSKMPKRGVFSPTSRRMSRKLF